MTTSNGGSRPGDQPNTRRQDLFDAVAATPPGENTWLTQGALGGALPEIEYLSGLLTEDDEVIAVAHCTTMLDAVQSGVLALTTERVLAVVGFRDERGRVIGEKPWAYSAAFRELADVTWDIGKNGCLGYFTVPGGQPVALWIGKDKAWQEVFSDAVSDEFNHAPSEPVRAAAPAAPAPQVETPRSTTFNQLEMTNGSKWRVLVEFNTLVELVDTALKAGGLLTLPMGITEPGTPRTINPQHIVQVIEGPV